MGLDTKAASAEHGFAPRTTEELVRAARKNSWRHVQRIDPTATRLYEEIYEVPESKTLVRVIDDHFVQIIYVAIQGDARGTVATSLRTQAYQAHVPMQS